MGTDIIQVENSHLAFQDLIWDSLAIMESKLVVKKNSTNWRDNSTHFHKTRYEYKAGTVSFALAWFQQGQVVKKNFLGNCYPILILLDREDWIWRLAQN